MKKFVVLLVVVAMTLVTSAVMAAEVTVGGAVDIRSRNFSNMDLDDTATDTSATQHRDTQSRIKLDVNAKAGDVKGKLQLWNDFETWGGFEAQNGIAAGTSGVDSSAAVVDHTHGYNNNTIGIREAWVNFPLPGIPVNVTAGHQLLTIGNGWFFRSMHFGSDAWVVASQVGGANLAFVNVKFSEGNAAFSDDSDAYALLASVKLSDDMKIGVDVTNVQDRTDKAGATPSRVNLMNIGANFNGKLGPVALKAQVDVQAGEVEDLSAGGTDIDFKGNQFVVQGNVPVGPVAINFTVARGSGDDAPADTKEEEIVTALDVDPHYTFLYEYKMATAAGAKNTGFANTTAVGVGASFKATKSLTISGDVWILQATETGAGVDDEVGQEIDLKVNWKIADNLTWNWVAGIFMPGDFYGANADDATGVQGILSFQF